MTEKQIKHLLSFGENVSVEFKRWGGKIELKLSDRTVRNYITELKNLKQIQRIGSDKSGYWEIMNRDSQGDQK